MAKENKLVEWNKLPRCYIRAFHWRLVSNSTKPFPRDRLPEQKQSSTAHIEKFGGLRLCNINNSSRAGPVAATWGWQSRPQGAAWGVPLPSALSEVGLCSSPLAVSTQPHRQRFSAECKGPLFCSHHLHQGPALTASPNEHMRPQRRWPDPLPRRLSRVGKMHITVCVGLSFPLGRNAPSL